MFVGRVVGQYGWTIPPPRQQMMGTLAVQPPNHLIFPRLPVRQWLVAVPKRRCYFLQRDAALQGAALRVFLRAVERCRASAPSRFGLVGALRRGRVHSPLRFHLQCPPALPLRGHRRRIRLRRRERDHLPCRHRARIATIRKAILRVLATLSLEHGDRIAVQRYAARRSVLSPVESRRLARDIDTVPRQAGNLACSAPVASAKRTSAARWGAQAAIKRCASSRVSHRSRWTSPANKRIFGKGWTNEQTRDRNALRLY